MPHSHRGDQHILSVAGPEVAGVALVHDAICGFQGGSRAKRKKEEEPCRASAAVSSLDSGISSSAQSFSVLANFDSAHDGTATTSGIAMDPWS